MQPVVLSGGAGTRLWPASRAALPKQLLRLTGDETMLQATALRARRAAGMRDRLMVVCNEAHRFLVAEQLRAIDMPAAVIIEPAGRNTAPAVALAALAALADSGTDEPPVLLVMPADHVITDRRAFLDAVSIGHEAARDGLLVTFGIVPDRPHTGYGYIESEARAGQVAPVRSFVEKPAADRAVELVRSGRYFWNAGIFMFRADAYLDELGRFAPAIRDACERSMAAGSVDADFVRPQSEAFLASPSDSVDYCIMERTDRAVMVPLDAGWSDVGSWSALHEISAKDTDGNALSGDVVAIDCRQTLVRAASRLVTAVGVEDLVIVEDDDAVLVTRHDRSQDVKKLVDTMSGIRRNEVKAHRRVFRPWGSYDSVDADDGFQVKRLIVNPGAVLSLQKHARRAEHWVVVRGTARITRNNEVFDLGVDESTYIAIGDVHRIANPGTEPVHIIEVQCGDYLGEDDIVRLEDEYGRQGTTS
ncbi:MAG: mannose-1-phosphate guanylyltransferase/mannose-6-phosphate isomerase [Ectothiorhodospiraceae bacterium]|nr:mannose-1-phosphate guanylyltransferase/mannose-6-phosphate isomerase [Ectothiorhodospiraceae bacterium]